VVEELVADWDHADMAVAMPLSTIIIIIIFIIIIIIIIIIICRI